MGESKGNKVLTLQQIIAKKSQRDQAVLEYKNLYLESLDGELVAKKPDRETAIEYLDEMTRSTESESVKEIYNICKTAIYNCIKTLREEELHKAYECVSPDEIVDKLFEIEEVIDLGTKIIDWNEKNVDQAKAELQREVDKDIKN